MAMIRRSLIWLRKSSQSDSARLRHLSGSMYTARSGQTNIELECPRRNPSFAPLSSFKRLTRVIAAVDPAYAAAVKKYVMTIGQDQKYPQLTLCRGSLRQTAIWSIRQLEIGRGCVYDSGKRILRLIRVVRHRGHFRSRQCLAKDRWENAPALQVLLYIKVWARLALNEGDSLAKVPKRLVGGCSQGQLSRLDYHRASVVRGLTLKI